MRKFFTLSALFLAFACGYASAQDRIISGKVTSSQDNLGIPGVTVVVVGSTVGAATDIDGNYKLTVPKSAKTLRFTGIGMKSKDVSLGTSNVVDVVMDADVMKLDAVVVTALGVKREKRSLGYTTKQVSNEDLNAGGQTNFVSALSGKVPGANITSTTGAPGGSSRIVLRGGSSVLGNNQALIVVDGVPINNSNNRAKGGDGLIDDLNNQVDYGNRAADINPEDIESVSVLEGQTAAALYGSQASNGVVMITTKKGKRVEGGKGKTDVTFSTGVTFSNPLKLPDFQNTYGQGDTYNDPMDRRENFSWGLPLDGQMRPWGQEIDLDGDGVPEQKIKPYAAVEDNVRDFFQTGVAYNNNLSFAGGSDKNTFYISLGAVNSNGMVPTQTYDKYNALVNASSKLSDKIEAGISVNYSHISNHPVTGGQRDASPFNQLIQTPRDINITELADQNDPFNKYDDVTGLHGFYGDYTINPYFSVLNYNNINKVDRVVGSMNVAWTPLTWLKVEDRLGADIYGDKREQKFKKYSYLPIDPFYGQPQTYQGKYSQDLYNQNNLYNDVMVTMTKKLSTDWNGSLLLGNGVLSEKTENTFASTNEQGGLSIPDYYNLANSFGRPISTNATIQRRMISWYAALNFDFKNMLFFSFTGRNDKSSTLPEGKNSYFYPSASVSWAFTELMNKDKKSFLSFGQLRLAYSKVGKDATPYLLKTQYVQTVIDGGFGTTTLPFGDIDGYTVAGNIGNDAVTPEFTTNAEIGTRLTFLDERIGLDFTYYSNNSKDQIVPISVSTASGFDTKTINIGKVTNKGVELLLDLVPVQNKNFRWDLTVSYTKNENEVVELYGGVDQVVLGGSAGANGMAVVAAVGRPYGTFYGVDLQRVDQSDPNSPVVVDPQTGLPKVTVNAQYFGSYLPDYQMSFGTKLSYKNWRLGMLFDMKQGGEFFSRTKDVMDFVGTAKETEIRNEHVWENSVYFDETDGTYKPNTTIYAPYDYFTNVIPSGQHLVDASFVKFRELSISYTFPEKMLKRSIFGSMSLGFYANNLMIWTADENKYVDPEMNSSGSSNVQGFDFSPTPSQRNYGFNFRVTF
jgi:TonB-linked SusC/RagA family outer membrane protein